VHSRLSFIPVGLDEFGINGALGEEEELEDEEQLFGEGVAVAPLSHQSTRVRNVQKIKQ
jgi:hypothetical protein